MECKTCKYKNVNGYNDPCSDCIFGDGNIVRWEGVNGASIKTGLDVDYLAARDSIGRLIDKLGEAERHDCKDLSDKIVTGVNNIIYG